ncbi:MAG: glycosyltransferase family 4 protein [Planctomycetes bacterium]|nr:glycosyltransferase family 4 protein [Planctomycetota bacterium]
MPHCDVVHIYSASYVSFLISPTPAILVSRMFRKPVILNYHSGEAKDHLQRSGRLTHWILTLPDRIVVQSPYLVDVFKQFGFAAVAIPNHVDISQIAYRERFPLQPKILVARVLEPLYNIPCAIKAFCLIKKKFPDARMTILGDGSQRKSLEHLVRELDVSDIVFTGRVEYEDIPGYFERHDVFLNTSSIDNMPVSILEAFMAGLPIVTTQAGGIGCMIRDRENGHLIALDDHVSAAQRVIELLEQPDEALRLTRSGREELQKYSWDAVSTKWQGLYSALAERSADSRSNTQLSAQDRIPKMDGG